jgi:hypothetical protein
MMPCPRDFPRCRLHGAGFVGWIGIQRCSPGRTSAGETVAPADRLAGSFNGSYSMP